MFHGITVTNLTEGARALTTVATAVIGLVVTAPDADAGLFPLGRPVLVLDLANAIEKVGAGGTARASLQAIADQVKAPVVLVRVAPGADAAATEAAVIGGTVDGRKTGLQALLAAEAELGVRPRILGVPGLETALTTAALAVIAAKLRGFAYARAIGEDLAALTAYRQGFGQRELMLLHPDFTAGGALSFAAARALGLRARIDQEQGFHKTLSNVPVAGATGLSEDVSFDIQDPASEAALLNAAGITALVRFDGLRFWGNRTCSAEPHFVFESAVRTGQVIQDTIAGGLAWAIDKPLRPSLVRDIVETVNEELRGLRRDGRILGGACWFEVDANPAAQLQGGKVVIDYDYTPVPPLEQLGLKQRITDRYFADFSKAVTA